MVLVNETLARRQFPNGDAVGRAVFVGRDVTPWTVVGIAADVRQFGLDKSPEPQFFVDLRRAVRSHRRRGHPRTGATRDAGRSVAGDSLRIAQALLGESLFVDRLCDLLIQ